MAGKDKSSQVLDKETKKFLRNVILEAADELLKENNGNTTVKQDNNINNNTNNEK